MAREACAAHPPTSREPTPVRGVALVLGGQNPITLEYQIYPPPIDTLVTGMHQAADLQVLRARHLHDGHGVHGIWVLVDKHWGLDVKMSFVKCLKQATDFFLHSAHAIGVNYGLLPGRKLSNYILTIEASDCSQ